MARVRAPLRPGPARRLADLGLRPREQPLLFERFTERARQVVVLAQDEARLLRHDSIGTEHLLLGLVREQGSPARLLESRGVTLERVRELVEHAVGTGEEAATGQIPFTPQAKRVLELALREALTLGDDHIGTEHVLLGLLRETRGLAVRILFELGTSPREVAANLTALGRGELSPDYLEGFAAEPGRTSEEPPASSRRGRSRRLGLAPLLAGWLLFTLALGIGILVGWLAWG